MEVNETHEGAINIEEVEGEVTQEVKVRKNVPFALPDTRDAIIKKMSLDNNEFYVIVGLYPNGKIGEIFIYASKTGSSMRGFAEGFAIMASRDLQNSGGDSIEWLIDTFKDSEFAPSGWTGYTPIPMAKSFLDLIVRWLEMRFL